MDYSSLGLFIAAVFMLAILPGPGILITVASALQGGLRRALLTITGIILGDVIFILLIAFGLKLVAEHLSGLFIAVKIMGGMYLIWLGLTLLFSRPKTQHTLPIQAPRFGFGGALSDVITGLIITLSNPKAILFYISFLPTFLNIETLSGWDIAIITLLICGIVGGVMLGYAIVVIKTRQAVMNNTIMAQVSKKIAGGLIAITGSWILIRQ